jgi:hypothetical protein
MINSYTILATKNLNGKYHFGDIGMYERIILK